MKLVVTIPAYNEEKTISKVIYEIPKKIEGIDEIRILVIDDGSTDKTFEEARKAGAIVIRNTSNMGLAFTFRKGLDAALGMDADYIVNTDADFQYNQKQIPLLLKPVLNGKADVVLGSRFAGTIESMPPQKNMGNRIATAVLRFVTGYKITDGQTGFRAFSREAALRMNLWSNYTYTHETLLHAAENRLVVTEVPVDFRKRADKSRLISSIWRYAFNAGKTLFTYYLYYRPLQLFGAAGALFSTAGLLAGSRVLFHFLETGMVSPYLPSAVLSAVLLILGFQLFIMGFVARIIMQQRRATEEMLYLMKKGMVGNQ